LDEEATDYLQRMTNAAARMQSLINDLLEYSQVIIRAEPPQPVDLGLVVAEVLSDLDERIRVSNGQIHVGPLPTILASPFQVRQLFQNLIANALKFHPPGVAPRSTSRRPRTAIREDREAGATRTSGWEIRVRDNGIGFDAKRREKSSRRSAPQWAPGVRGTGMGLAICRRIVAFLGGTITASSRPGEGATFVVTLPGTAAIADPLAPAA
jgi:signal transduction histidine kinase